MKISFSKSEYDWDKDRQIFIDSKFIGTIEHNTVYRRFPYTVDLNGIRLVTDSGHDCFSNVTLAKKAVRERFIS